MMEGFKHKTKLRKAGDSVMFEVPPAILGLLRLGAGARVTLDIQDGRLVIEPEARLRYSLDDLLAQCDATASASVEGRTWVDAKPAGRELL